MKVSTSQYGGGGAPSLKPGDVKNGQRFVIEKFEEVTTKLGTRPILRFKGTEQAFFLNQTNLRTMIEKFGDETTKWIGKQIRFDKVRVNNPTTNRMQDGLRIQ